MDRDTLENMPMERLAEIHKLVNTVYNERQATHKQELILNLCKAYNELRCAYPDLGYFPIKPNFNMNCTISAPQNAFENIGYTMNPDWFNTIVKMEVMG